MPQHNPKWKVEDQLDNLPRWPGLVPMMRLFFFDWQYECSWGSLRDHAQNLSMIQELQECLILQWWDNGDRILSLQGQEAFLEKENIWESHSSERSQGAEGKPKMSASKQACFHLRWGGWARCIRCSVLSNNTSSRLASASMLPQCWKRAVMAVIQKLKKLERYYSISP